MSFRCDRCEGKVGPKVKPILHVSQTRNKVYREFKDGELVESKGWEIVKELKLCSKCAAIVKFLDESKVVTQGGRVQ